MNTSIIFSSSTGTHQPNTAMVTPAKKNHSVRFSESPEVFIIEPQGHWYMAAERLSFRTQVIRDATHVRRMTAADPEQNGDIFSEEDKYKCIGLEMFFSRAIARERMQRRHIHTNAILMEQAAQRIRNDENDENLRLVSKVSSFWGCEIARVRAATYMSI
mmetsp:Transcript_22509/g.46334  ORF Transcript_22509/g.46334 Transcript_22509/m.46334 type:complete len:160 (-) Transcript_22509:61-540(-)